MKKENSQEKFKTMIGGQALIEGIMMRGPEKQAIVCRSKGELVSKVETLTKKTGILTLPLIRGIVNFGGSMVGGVKSLMYSAELVANEEEDAPAEEPSKFEQWLEKKLGSEKFMSAVIGFAAFLGIAFSVFLFFLVPIWLGDLLQSLTKCSDLLKNLLEGVLRIVIFVLYMALISRMKDMKRVFAYHGAEHKTIRCYEAKLPLTVENVRPMTRMHPRCGTSFLFVVMILSILLFTVVSQLLKLWIPALAVMSEEHRLGYNFIMMGIKIVVLLPLVVSISYELNRLVGRHDNSFTRLLTKPGMAMQRFTTNEPDDSMIECAIEALKLVLPSEEGQDKW